MAQTTAPAPATSASPPASAAGKPITTEIDPPTTVTLHAPNRGIRATWIAPKTAAKEYPGVIYIHDIFGTNDFARSQAETLARQGYGVLMPNLYSRLDNADKGFDAQGAWLAYEKTPDPQVMQDLRAAIDYLNDDGRPTANQPLAVVGHDMGGIYAMKLAAADLRISAAVNYYGRIVYAQTSVARQTSPVDDLFNLRAPLLSFYGTIDPQVPAEHLRALESRLANNPNKTYYDLVRLPDTGHGFLVPTRQGYNAAAAGQAEARTREFLATFLRGTPRKPPE
jgi:carboxymethylenebutenolidase